MNLRMHRGLVDEDEVVIEVDGHTVSGRRGDSVAVALLTVGISTLRHSPRLGAPPVSYTHLTLPTTPYV